MKSQQSRFKNSVIKQRSGTASTTHKPGVAVLLMLKKEKNEANKFRMEVFLTFRNSRSPTDDVLELCFEQVLHLTQTFVDIVWYLELLILKNKDNFISAQWFEYCNSSGNKVKGTGEKSLDLDFLTPCPHQYLVSYIFLSLLSGISAMFWRTSLKRFMTDFCHCNTTAFSGSSLLFLKESILHAPCIMLCIEIKLQ